MDSLLFKIPSLRNRSFTSPYIYDGRFRKLREVLAHYVDNPDERVELIAFLLTLNDRDFVFNPAHRVLPK